MPDGRTGALHGGLVFPLADGSIDVAGPNALPALCRPLGHAAPPTGAPPELVEGESEAVLLLGGSVVERDEHAAKLRAAGLQVLATGARIATSPDDPGWFIRLRRPGDGRDLAALVRAALAAAPVRPAAPAQRLAVRAEELSRLRAERDAERSAAARERDALAARIAALEQALAAASAPPSRPDEPPAPVGPVPSPAPPARAVTRLQDEIACALKVFAPTVELVQDSLPTIATELDDRGPLYAALHELGADGRGMPLGWKRLADAQGWWERHLATGRDRTGRLYARHDPARSRWSVLVSTKARQKRDTAWLRGQPAG